uniref:RAC family serine/threonineprotein kinase putative n=1 Tax=Albugo laibachii Nc14 TaxID=890382 RepID=F0W094_9STRA|nr:RAC family serine/threonineprotein kinase putative [Albugo laibachii Nc14]|eukprot:CCA14465.1 RAC family serine/threonineprotein kinase putative [Albugo laibachii Nc14]
MSGVLNPLTPNDMRQLFFERIHVPQVRLEEYMGMYKCRCGQVKLQSLRDTSNGTLVEHILSNHIEWLSPHENSSEGVSKRKNYLNWNDYFMSVAFLSAMRSKDPSTQVGACIVNREKKIVGIGYNGFPNGCDDDDLPWARKNSGDDILATKYPYVCHAEMNAILNKNSADVDGCTVSGVEYVYMGLIRVSQEVRPSQKHRVPASEDILKYSNTHILIYSLIGRTLLSHSEDEMEELIHCVIAQIQCKLKNDLLLREIFIPNSKAEAKCNIFVSYNYATCSKLCIFMQVGPDLQPGIWSTTIHPKNGFQGSMLPYLKTAIQSGYGIVIMNPNTNVAIVQGHRAKILHSSSPEEHALHVWKQYVVPNAASEISIIALEEAGSLVKAVLRTLRSQDEKRLCGVAFIGFNEELNSSDSERVRHILKTKCVNFQASKAPTFTDIPKCQSRLGCTTLSIGQPTGDMNACDWTMHSVQTSAFVFLQAIAMGLREAIDAIRATFPNKLVVTINRARLTGQPYNNPFAVVQCVGQKKETPGNHRHTMDPEWNQTFSFPVTKSDEVVTVTVRDKDKLIPMSSTSLGQVVLQVSEIGLNRTDRRWHTLRDERDQRVRGHGEVELTVEWVRDTFVARSETFIRSGKSGAQGSAGNPFASTMIASKDGTLSMKEGNQVDRDPIHSENGKHSGDTKCNGCYLCQATFVFGRKKYCRMCLRIVCASCSDRLFLPGFSEAKRVCDGCCDLQMMLHTKLPRMGKNTTFVSNKTLSQVDSKSNNTDSLSDERLKVAAQKMEAMRQREMAKSLDQKPLGIEDFDLLKVVGRGAFGKVLLVRKKEGKSAGQIYAMKILVKAHIVKNDQIENTKAEQHILKVIDHPFIVRLRYAFQNRDKLYLIIDYYPGGSMFYHLKKSKRFTEERTRLYIAQLLTALMHLHEKQIAYRDLKLENILMDSLGNVALTDFGLSKEGQLLDGAIRASQASTGMKTICGTAEYMAPELLRHQPYGKVVDWWSFGILSYEMLTGRTPFVDRNRRQMFKNIMQSEVIYPSYISPTARSLISKLLERDPSKRLGSGPEGGHNIMNHAFFESIDWDKLARKEYKPNFVPDVSSVDDITNVPEMFQNMAAVDSPVNSKGGEHHFDDFTFQEDSYLRMR